MNRRAWILLLAITAPMAVTAAEGGRWYTPAQVAQGEAVFQQHCASCHGTNAEATPDWRKPEPDGKYPPPPLNGTAHAWHHPLGVLRSVIREGGARVGGKMPPFENTLSPGEIDSAIAFFQAKWTDEIYNAWRQRNPGGDLKPISRKEALQPAVTRLLKQRLGDAEISAPVASSVAGIFEVRVGNRVVYVTDDGRYVFTGDLIDLKTGVNLTARVQAERTLDLLKSFPETDMVIYAARGTENAVLTVFTDTSCPYCRKLHAEVPRLQAKGVTVRYIPFSRGGRQGEGYPVLRSVWCAPDPPVAMSIAKGTRAGELPTADCVRGGVVDAGYALGRRIGIKGTPALILPDGRRVDGYMPPGRLLQALGLGTADRRP